jgi:hypothetical protein
MTNEPRGCLAFLFGFGSGSRPAAERAVDPGASEEGNYHSGPGGYEDGSYVGGYAADYRAEHTIFDEGDNYEAEEH